MIEETEVSKVISVGNSYKYKNLCKLFGEKQKTGKSKQYQLKNWRRFFTWENPTKQQFFISEIYKNPIPKEDGRKSNGGARKGSGRERVLEDQFRYLLAAFLHMERTREFAGDLYGHWHLYDVTCTKGYIADYFGILPKSLYSARKLEHEDQLSLEHVIEKLLSIRKSLILDKIDRVEGVYATNGVVMCRGSRLDFPNEYVMDYHRLREEWLKEHNTTLFKAVKNDEWMDIARYIAYSSPFYSLKADLVFPGICIHTDRTNGLYDDPYTYEYDFDTIDRYRSDYVRYAAQQVIAWATRKGYDVKSIEDILERYLIAPLNKASDSSLSDGSRCTGSA